MTLAKQLAALGQHGDRQKGNEDKPERPKDRIDMIADISKSGKLLEMGCDPFTHAPESKAVATQTEGSGTKMPVQQVPTQSNNTLEIILSSKDIVKTTNSGASQVLRLAVGMLGMEVHEQPSSWAEQWLTFEDQTFASLGLGSKKPFRPKSDSDFLGDTPAEWQLRVLEHLRQHVEQRSANPIDDLPVAHDWGPNFQEHLDLAEFCLLRITHGVNVLQDPEKHDRPLLLREYTEEMVMKVCKDLRQWLDQLSTLLSLYHVHLLDLEAERRKLAQLLEVQQAKFQAGEEERKAAVRKFEVINTTWEEEKMKRDAERILGISCAGEDEKIYSQKELDEIQQRWEKENLEPLLLEIRDLRLARDELQNKLRAQRGAESTASGSTKPSEPKSELSLSKASLGMLVSIVGAVNDRTYDKALNKCLTYLGDDLDAGAENLAVILSDINKIPLMDEAQYLKMMQARFGPMESNDKAGKLGGDSPVVECLSLLATEFANLESELQKCPVTSGAQKLKLFANWTKETVDLVNGGLQKGKAAELRWQAPPKWDLGILNKSKGNIRNVGVNTTDDLLEGLGAGGDEIRKKLEADYALRMKRLRDELEKKIRDALAEAERERINAQEALERLAEEAIKSDVTLAELRRKIAMLEALLRERGLGKQAADAMWGSGLSEFMQGRDVFERLYRDALDRMRRNAEAQARYFEETSMEFLKTIGTIVDPNLKLPGLDYERLAERESSPASNVGERRSSPGSRSPPISRSPPGSPQVSRSPPRLVASAPSRLGENMGELLSVGRLGPAVSPQLSRQRMEGTNSRQTQNSSIAHGSVRASSATALQKRERPDNALHICQGLGSSPTLLQEARRQASQSFASQIPPRSRQTAARSMASDFKMLPPLECRGQGHVGARSRSPSNDELEEKMRRMRATHSGSSMHEAKTAERGRDHFPSPGKDPLLVIGALKSGGGGAPPSGLMPPSMGQERQTASGKLAGGRPSTHGGIHRRQGGAISMPHLGPPRLLVQSVGAAY